MELSNPDVMLQALDAERQLAQAEADLINLRATSDGNTLQHPVAGSPRWRRRRPTRSGGPRPTRSSRKTASSAHVEARQQVEHATELRDRAWR